MNEFIHTCIGFAIGPVFIVHPRSATYTPTSQTMRILRSSCPKFRCPVCRVSVR